MLASLDERELLFLRLIDGIKIKETDDYSKVFYWEKDGVILIEQNIKHKFLYINYEKMYVPYYEKFGMGIPSCDIFFQDILERMFGWNGITEVEPMKEIYWIDVK